MDTGAWHRGSNNETDEPCKIGLLLDREEPNLMVDIVPPACSNYFDRRAGSLLIRWADKVLNKILHFLHNKKNLIVIVIGISFWSVDLWELKLYVTTFLSNNEKGMIYVLIFDENEEEKISKYFSDWGVDRYQFLFGSFTDNWEKLANYI